MVKHILGQRKCPKNKFPDTDVKYMGSGKFIKNSENKYGLENFTKLIIAITETKQKISESLKGRIPWNKGIKYSENQKINLRGKCDEKNSFYGKHHSEDAKLKNRNPHLGKRMSEETKQKISKTMKLIKLKEKQNGTL